VPNGFRCCATYGTVLVSNKILTGGVVFGDLTTAAEVDGLTGRADRAIRHECEVRPW